MVVALSAILAMGCDSPGEPAWRYPDAGKLYVFSEYNTWLGGQYTPGLPADDLDNFTMGTYLLVMSTDFPDCAWYSANQGLEEKINSQWKNSSYYSPTFKGSIIFAPLKSLSIVSNVAHCGRERLTDISDLFLFKPIGPIFTFPEGDMLNDEDFDRWMTIEEWTSKNYVCQSFELQIQGEVEECDDIPIIFSCKATFLRSDLSGDYVSSNELWLGRHPDGRYGGYWPAYDIKEEDPEFYAYLKALNEESWNSYYRK